jgi:hypothetical protein
MKSFSLAGALFALLLAATPSHARQLETVDVSGAFNVLEGETVTVNLRNWTYVDKLYVQAVGGPRQDSTVDVLVNGEEVATLFLPKTDPSYTVNIKDTINSIQFRHRSGGYGRILNVKAVQAGWGIADRGFGRMTGNGTTLPVTNQGSMLARQAIEIVSALSSFADFSDQVQFLHPIKRSAAQAYAKAAARGDLSSEVHGKLVALVHQIDAAESYMNRGFEANGLFEKMTELLTLRERIEALLR